MKTIGACTKPEEMKEMDQTILTEFFSYLDFRIIHLGSHPESNGVDMWVQKLGQRPLSVEIKKARIMRHGIAQVDPVSKNRRGDDLIAIIINKKYVLIEPMSDHLKACSPGGTRQFTILKCGG